jgi:ABC-type molybdate transport system substrate-binding protein
MNLRLVVRPASSALAFLLALSVQAEAAEVKVLTAFGMQAAIEDLAPKFEAGTGHKLALAFGIGGAVLKRAQDGEATDVVITLRPAIDRLAKTARPL